MAVAGKKTLLVLDVNGLLLETYFQAEKRPEEPPPDGKVGKFYVYRRPFCKEFLEFCFENFAVGVWSSAQRHNVDKLVDFIFGDLKRKLLFSWHQIDCTDTGLKTRENSRKPLFLKELSKLWNKAKPDLPWEEGDYGPFNTLLIDDTPYKALRNPPHTAIFPHPYKVGNDPENILGGALRKYLEGLLTATNVQHYVKNHPFGQLVITSKNPDWCFYSQVLGVKEPVDVYERNWKLLSSTKQIKRTTEILQGKHLLHDNLHGYSLDTGIHQHEKNLLENEEVNLLDDPHHQHSIPGMGVVANGMFETVVACIAGSNGSHNSASIQECKANNMSQDVAIPELQIDEKDILENKEVNVLDDPHNRRRFYKEKRKKKRTYHSDGQKEDTGGKHSSNGHFERDLLKEEKNRHPVHVQCRKHNRDLVDKHHRHDNYCSRQLDKDSCDNYYPGQSSRGNHNYYHPRQCSRDYHKYSQHQPFVDLPNYHYGNKKVSEVPNSGFQYCDDINRFSSNPVIPAEWTGHSQKQPGGGGYLNGGVMMVPLSAEWDFVEQSTLYGQNLWPNVMSNGKWQGSFPSVQHEAQANNYYSNESNTMLSLIPIAQRGLTEQGCMVGQNLGPDGVSHEQLHASFYNTQYQACSQRYSHTCMPDDSQPHIRDSKRYKLKDGHSQRYYNRSRTKRFEHR